ncbi:CPBP family intramembrane glutamic endopeptidase [Deinococcus maricopensis]|uniref:Abortive infection protein n=1 Tax=Deinococcus maricopensis (strain DSM 21211 / LMG 22137 / NRRL B-23946 / LB-34) TaxID=709986 RepID=E8U5Y0_DEIML|nr:CPBP family intramembrane glutamic endopeptidase [Deinococcus maricopensis]ADV66469.1 Abortive infection protein [Deinococcus maricopensis DSM 21211]
MTPTEPADARPPGVRLSPLSANRAFATILLLQNVIGGLVGLRSIGWGLIAASVLNAVTLLVFFRPALRDLTRTDRWRTPPPVLTTLGALLLTLTSGQALLAGLLGLWPELRLGYDADAFSASGAGLVPLLIGGALLVPFIEELAFRGFLLTAYERALGVRAAGLAVAGLFALAHAVPLQALGILPAAWILTRAVQHTGSFWTGYAIHVLNNTAALLLPALARSGPPWLRDEAATLTRPQALLALGLSVALLALATRWLRPRPVQVRTHEPVWSASLITVMVLTALVFAGALLGILYVTLTGGDLPRPG